MRTDTHPHGPLHTARPPLHARRGAHARAALLTGRVRIASGVLARLALGALLASLLLLTATACAVHPGEAEIAYLRDGRLWTVNPDGTGAQAVAGGNVVGFAWSPDHHQLVFRYGSGAPAPQASSTAPDAPSQLGVIGVDGGAAVTITSGGGGLARSDAWWDPRGNRLLYREGFLGAPGQEPLTSIFVLAQADQPAGIARRPLPGGETIPAMAPDGAQVAMIDSAGNLRVGAPNAAGRVLATGALSRLPGVDRPARLLWQPGHQALLYARPTQETMGAVALVLTDLVGHARTVGTAAALLDDAFSPSGSLLLVRTATALEVWDLGGQAQARVLFSWPEADPAALAWWSPDSRYVLMRDRAGLWLADVRAQRTERLLASAGDQGSSAVASPRSWHPLAGSPWSADGRQIVFADPGTGTWQGHALPEPRSGAGGLYVAGIGPGAAAPRLIAGGPSLWPSWSYLDPSASLLVGA